MAGATHKAVVKEEFTRQANSYAVSSTVTDPSRIARLVDAVAPAPESRVLDVACGPGFLALAFAQRCRGAIGLDLTEAGHCRKEPAGAQLGECPLPAW